jgi:hypothetical protein
MKMVPTVEYGGKSYRVPACNIRKQEDAAKMVDPKLQKRRLSKLKSAISKYASESGETLSAEQVGEIIKKMTLPDGYLPSPSEPIQKDEVLSTTQKESFESETKKEGAPVRIVKHALKKSEHLDSKVQFENEECKSKCSDCECVRVPLQHSKRELFN